MANEKKAFSELLKDAPLSSQEDTVSLVGALARSSQPGKFVLSIGQGESVTLDAAAVKGHQVLSGGVGQLLVQVDVARDKVPDYILQRAQPAGVTAHNTPITVDLVHNSPVTLDYTTIYILDHGTVFSYDHVKDPRFDITGHFPYPD